MKSLIPFRNNLSLTDNTFEDFYKTMENFFKDQWGLEKASMMGSFKLDVQEKEHEYVVEAELPGYKKEEIFVDLNNEMLTISAKKEEKTDKEEKNYVHRERKVESVKRSLFLDGSKAEGVKAKLDNGVLSITIPKEKKEASASKITIE